MAYYLFYAYLYFDVSGFFLRSYSFHEQPKVHFTYEYLLVAETDDPSRPIICGDAAFFDEDINDEDSCPEFQVLIVFSKY